MKHSPIASDKQSVLRKIVYFDGRLRSKISDINSSLAPAVWNHFKVKSVRVCNWAILYSYYVALCYSKWAGKLQKLRSYCIMPTNGIQHREGMVAAPLKQVR